MTDGFQAKMVARGGTREKPGRPIFISLNGMPIPPETVHHLITKNTVAFEDVYIDYSNNLVNPSFDPFSGAPVSNAILINLFSRISDFDDLDLMRAHTNKITITKGFEPQKKFYTPRYIDYKIEAFSNYGMIHWEPNLTFSKSESLDLTTIDTKLEGVNFHIEGIASDGSIFSQVIRLDKNTQK